MITKYITYVNFDEEQVTETFYFHLSKKKLLDLAKGGYEKKLERIGSKADGGEIMATITELIGFAYGVRIDGDGSTFKQSEEISENFLNSLAFDVMLMEFITDPPKTIDFVNAIMPKDLMKMAEEQLAAEGVAIEKPKFVTLPGNFEDDDSGLKDPRDKGGALLPWAFREPNTGELQHMTKTQMADVYRRSSAGWKPPSRV